MTPRRAPRTKRGPRAMEAGPGARETGLGAREADTKDRPDRRTDPVRGNRGRPRPAPPRAPAVRATRPAVRRRRHRTTGRRGRGSRRPHGSDPPRCVFGSRIHRTTPMAILWRGIGASVTGRLSRAVRLHLTRTTIPAGTP
jgi:hypothetical protein